MWLWRLGHAAIGRPFLRPRYPTYLRSGVSIHLERGGGGADGSEVVPGGGTERTAGQEGRDGTDLGTYVAVCLGQPTAGLRAATHLPLHVEMRKQRRTWIVSSSILRRARSAAIVSTRGAPRVSFCRGQTEIKVASVTLHPPQSSAVPLFPGLALREPPVKWGRLLPAPPPPSIIPSSPPLFPLPLLHSTLQSWARPFDAT